ncbi:MAG: DNA polymerase III subunit gamma/tau [Tenericutes bacterium]|nr:DNA polymerase III subunit gamma/tau [Mycoplasmatota bacterium]
MKYLALYRKYRPSRFEEISGQEGVVGVLKNAIKTGRISHAYLFCGPRGTGKTTTAKLLAKMVNCTNPIDGEPCGKCESCLSIFNNTNDDIIEIDAASNNGVDEIRELRDKINLVPSNSKYKVYIIDEVHMLTVGAFNALLKTLEEPPSHVIFVLATTETYKVPLTISSRCQKFRFDKITVDNIVKRLEEICNIEKIVVSSDILNEIARLADGGMRDAINLLDQLVSYKGNDITINDVYDITGLVSYEIIYELLLSSYNKDMSSIVKILDDINYSGKNISKFIEEIILFLKDVLVYKNITDYSLNLDKLNKVKEISDLYDNNLIYNYVNELNNVLNNIKNSSYPLLLLEVALIKLVNLEKKEESILEKVNVKESKNNVKAEKNTSNMSIKNDIIKEDVFPKLSNEELKHISYLKEVRVNNAFVSANKSLLNKFKEKWSLVFEYLTNDKYANIVGLLKDVNVVVAGKENLIFQSKFSSVAASLNSQSELLSELFYKIYGVNYKTIVLSNSEWDYEKKKYIDNLNNKYVYEMKVEKTKEQNDIKYENSSNLGANDLVDILGAEVIEYK